jgi:hypothetical protein
MSDYARFPVWQMPCAEAMAELDPRKILERVDAAESAIFQRLLAMADHPGSLIELQMLDAALAKLIILRAGSSTGGQARAMPA